MPKVLETGLSSLLIIGLVVLHVFAIWGLVYLTKFAYAKKLGENHYCVKMTTFERNLTRLTTALLWVTIAVDIIVQIFLSCKSTKLLRQIVGVSRFAYD